MPSLTENYIIRFAPNLFCQDLTSDILEIVADLEPVLLQIAGAYWHEEEQDVFATEGASIGQPWEPNGEGYAAWKLWATGQSRVGVLSGRLEASVANTMFTTATSVSIGTDVPYASDFESDSDEPWTAKYGGSSFSGRGHPGRILIGATPEKAEGLQQLLQDYIDAHDGLEPGSIIVDLAA